MMPITNFRLFPFSGHVTYIVAGIPPGDSGTGRMLRQLMTKAAKHGENMRFVYRQRPSKPLRPLLREKNWKEFISVGLPYFLGKLYFRFAITWLLIAGRGNLLIMHPQTLGFQLTIRLMKAWKRGRVFLYVLDSSYFCVRSYNYIPGETAPCLRCLGGQFDQRKRMSCAPFPVQDETAADYVKALHEQVRKGRVNLLAQNENQRDHIIRHFGEVTQVRVVGLWGEEWTELFDEWEEFQRKGDESGKTPGDGSLVIHTFYVPAKGADWFLEVAGRTPGHEFFCPFPKATAITSTSENLNFGFLTWESGLKERLRDASFAAVPSLWSAPIEGALVKSLVINPRTLILENDSAFQNELPDSIVLRLSGDPKKAAVQLKQAFDDGWTPNMNERNNWIKNFRAFNERFFQNIVDYLGEKNGAHTSHEDRK